jgi:hypothetical protein
MSILNIIASRNYITLNKDILKEIGLEETVILGELASEYDYWYKQGKLEDGYFFSTIENIEMNTTLSEHKQRKAINNLKNLGIIEVVNKGLPKRRYIKLNEEKILYLLSEIMEKNSSSNPLKIQGMVTEKLKINNNINNNNINNNKESNINITKESKKFTKPTIEDLKAYCEEKGLGNVDVEYFYDYYESNGWQVGKSKMKDYKATLRNWNRRNYNTNTNNNVSKEKPYEDKLIDGTIVRVWNNKQN